MGNIPAEKATEVAKNAIGSNAELLGEYNWKMHTIIRSAVLDLATQEWHSRASDTSTCQDDHYGSN